MRTGGGRKRIRKVGGDRKFFCQLPYYVLTPFLYLMWSRRKIKPMI